MHDTPNPLGKEGKSKSKKKHHGADPSRPTPNAKESQRQTETPLKKLEKTKVSISELRDPNYVPAARRQAMFQGQFSEAVALHQKAIDGDKDAVSKAFDQFTQLRDRSPNKNLIEAYLGSTIALMGRDAIDPTVRFEKALKGLRMLDAAVASDPENTEIRTIRGYVSYRLPEMYFHRGTTAIQDFTYLAEHYEQDPSLFSPKFYWKLLYDLGMTYKNMSRNQQATETWRKLLEVCKDDSYEDLLQAEGMNPRAGAAPKGTDTTSSSPQARDSVKKKSTLIAEAQRLHDLACSGTKDDLRTALEHAKQAADAAPANPLLKAYYADCQSMMGREATDSSEMFTNAIMAIQQLDQAISLAPDNPKIRLLRAYQSLRLPETFFRRTSTAIGDFEHLLDLYSRDPSILPVETYWKTLYDLGLAYQTMGLEREAQDTWNKLLTAKPSPEYVDLVQSQKSDELRVRSTPHGDSQALINEGIRLHDLAVSGKKQATKLALEFWEKVTKSQPDDPLAQAYYASSLALSGRDASDASTMFSNTIKGMKLLNSAVSLDTNNPRIRVLRAYLLYSLPEAFFHMSEEALNDFQFLRSAYQQDPSFFTTEQYHQFLYDLGVLYQRNNEPDKAQKVWSELMQAGPSPELQALLHGKVGSEA